MKNAKNIVHCTPDEFVEVLKTKDTAKLVAGIFDTPVDFNKYDKLYLEVDGKRKKNPDAVLNPFFEEGVRCVSKKFKLVTGFHYEESLRKQWEAENAAENALRRSQGLPEKVMTWNRGETWYNLVTKTLAVHKNDPTKFYFRYQYLDDSIIYADYYFQGNDIDRTIFKQFLKDKSKAYKNQGLDDPTAVQVVSIDNIIECTIDGTTYILKHNNAKPYWAKYYTQTIGQDGSK